MEDRVSSINPVRVGLSRVTIDERDVAMLSGFRRSFVYTRILPLTPLL